MSFDSAGMIGAQRPRIHYVPDFATGYGQEAIDLANAAGLKLDPWQQLVIKDSLGTRPDGKFASFEVGLCVGRQNGKGSILEARELWGLFLGPERMIVHSAHMFDTSIEHFRRLLFLVENNDFLRKKVKRISRSHGEEGIELLDRSRIRFRTRTKGGGRGFTGDLLVLDEAMELADAFYGALLPTLSATSVTGNPQVWLTGSAVDQTVHDNGVVFARIRERGHAGVDPLMSYFEWSAPFETQEEVPDPGDVEMWAIANPGLGIRIAVEHVAAEFRSLGHREFLVERLGVGDWPETDPEAGGKIKVEAWNALLDALSQPQDPIYFAYDVSEDRKWASIAVCGLRSDKKAHLEVVERMNGTDWVPKRLQELTQKHKYVSVLTHATGPGASLIHEMEHLGVKVAAIPTHEYVKACGLLYDTVERQTLRHLGQPELATAIKGAVERQIDDAWAWSRKNSHVDISPLVAVTLAHWGATEYRPTYRAAGF